MSSFSPPALVVTRPLGRVTTGARSTDEEPKPTGPDLRCWAKFVRGTPYNGEYGFDWMDWQRDPDPKNLNDWITQVQGFPIAEFTHFYDETLKDKNNMPAPQYVEVAKDAHLKRKLQGEYRRLTIYGEDYYAAWLSVRPGQEVKLQLAIEALNTDSLQGDYLTFAPHANYQVTVNGQVNEAIRLTPVAGSSAQSPQLVDVTIKCLKACQDTELKVLDEKGKVVGQLNVVDNTKTYRLPLRVVYLVKDTNSAVDLGNLQRGFAALNLKKYLNEESLNQAQIQVEFENTNQVYEIVFKEAEWAGKFYDVANDWYTDHKGVNKDGSSFTIPFLDNILSEYLTRFEKNGLHPFRGIILIVTNIRKNPADNEGGVSKVIPVDFRAAVIFGSNVQNKSSYAHEIGHALGLNHTFLDADDNKELTQFSTAISVAKANIEIYKNNRNNVFSVNIKNHQANIDNVYNPDIEQRRASLRTNASYYLQHPLERQKAEQYLQQVMNSKKKELATIEEQKKLSRENDRKQVEAEKQLVKFAKEIATYASNPYKFKKGTTVNIMDYISTRNSFFYWQWQVLQRDIVRYYGKAE